MSSFTDFKVMREAGLAHHGHKRALQSYKYYNITPTALTLAIQMQLKGYYHLEKIEMRRIKKR